MILGVAASSIKKLAYPAYKAVYASGIVNNATGSLAVPYLASIAAGDLLVMAVLKFDDDTTLSTPTNWSVINQNNATNCSTKVMYKIATGSESGTEAVTFTNNGDYAFGLMFSFSGGMPSGTPVEDIVSAAPALTVGESLSNGLSSGDKRLAVMVYLQNNNDVVTNNSTGYTQQFTEDTTAGSDCMINVCTQQLADSSSVDGTVEYTTVTARYNTIIGFMIKPDVT